MAKKLTTHRDVKFELCFSYPLQKGYTFDELSKQNIKDFQRFLDKISKMNVQQVDQLYARRPDKRDMFNGEQIYHYEVTDAFRIHVVLEDGLFKVLRLDPNHKKHNK